MEENKNEERFEHIQEKLKERPINRKKLLKTGLATATMAALFGLTACFTFLVLEPVFSNWLYPEEEPDYVTILEAEEDEILPEDMMIEEEETVTVENTTIVNQLDLTVADIQKLSKSLYDVVEEVQKSIVEVSGVSQDVDWFNNTYESGGQDFGLCIADNGRELLILVKQEVLNQADNIQVTFTDGKQYGAAIKETDANTNLAIVAVERSEVEESTLESFRMVSFGNSNTSELASPVIAIGSPYGIDDSVAYGMITSKSTELNMIDYNYQLLTTDIYGSKNGNGILVNFSGNVIGIITQEYNSSDVPNLISAIGISELKSVIERMSNGKKQAMLGIHCADVSEEASEATGIPFGAYVTEIVMDSPAMQAGIQSGDVIVKMDDMEIASVNIFVKALGTYQPGDTVQIIVMRQGMNEYQEMEVSVTLAE